MELSIIPTGLTYNSRPWRQLVMLYNFHYQYGLPPKPIYWWDKWDKRNLNGNLGPLTYSEDEFQTDEAQLFLYTFAENLMHRHGGNGRECLLKAICENAQIDVHQGLYAELLYRFLRPHRNLDSYYVDAWHMGLKGVDCQSNYPKATNCLLDKYTHVREEYMGYTTVK
ncbi:uncharacterized protein LOC133323369 [Musca vetustissima]|uniref:uncharacterized protein LOC133323369 n=1 Tax=Musca vetustissima TaxID=27455 RepID=UPI002AB73389|nr:uncharacterized protein LOC133323369 [Musca vetustissima]